MNDLNKALGDISSIRRQMARSTEFRGYGPATLAATGIFAVMAAVGQAIWLPNPSKAVSLYLATWISTAVVSAALIAAQMLGATLLFSGHRPTGYRRLLLRRRGSPQQTS